MYKLGDKVISFLDEAFKKPRILIIKDIVPSLSGSLLLVKTNDNKELILPHDAVRYATEAELVLFSKQSLSRRRT